MDLIPYRLFCIALPLSVVSKCAHFLIVFSDMIVASQQRDIFATAKVILLCKQSSYILFASKTRVAKTTRLEPNITAKQ